MKKTKALKEEKPSAILIFFEKYYLFFLIVLLSAVCFNCFYHLGQFPARDWDEARHGVSAYEMLKNNNYIVNTYAYQTDYYNLKPPLSFWGIIVGYKLFGYNLFGMRFYSALSFAVTAAITALFALKRYGRLESLAVTLLIACCSPFYCYHFARHGDADALFMLFVVISVFSVLLAEERRGFLYLSGFAFSLAFLTKSWYSFMIVAVVGAYMVVSKFMFRINWKQWLIYLASAIGPILIWLAVRYRYDGFEFLKNMINIDLLNRVSQPLEGHTGGFFYYVQLIFVMSLTTGLFPVCIALCYGSLKLMGAQDVFSSMNGKFKRDFSLYVLWILIPLILFTVAQTKLLWYAIPIFFAVVVLAGLLFAQVMKSPKKYRVFRILLCGVLLLTVIPGFARTWTEMQPAYEDTLQPFLAEKLTQNQNVRGKNAYLVIDQPLTLQKWDQSYLLVGELYLDLRCQSGGVQDFLNHPQNSILIISGGQYERDAGLLKNCKVVDRGGEYLCLAAE